MPYASVNGLGMYYETHGDGAPLVLLHGALSAIGTSFGTVLPGLARSRQVIAVEMQAHGRTADIDRPLTLRQMAEDTAALLLHLGVESADVFGYSLGAGVAVELAIRHPELVRRLVAASVTYSVEGFHPGMVEGMDALQPEQLAGTPFAQEYASIAPNPGDWPALIAKLKELNKHLDGWSPEAVRGIQAPTLLVFGDSDIVRPEHAVEMFRLLGGGVNGDVAGLPRSQLAVLPATTHIGVMFRDAWLVSMVEAFLDAPTPVSTPDDSGGFR